LLPESGISFSNPDVNPRLNGRWPATERFPPFFQIFGNAFSEQRRYRQRFGVQTGKMLHKLDAYLYTPCTPYHYVFTTITLRLKRKTPLYKTAYGTKTHALRA
jgi:hypothetical protein